MPEQPTEAVWTISALNAASRDLLESAFQLVWIEGEISNFSRPSSGHWYFSLKDEQAQIRGAMFRHRNQQVKFVPQDGTKVLVQATVSLYEPRGDYQLIAQAMEERGDGHLQRQFELLKKKLQAAGLFDPRHKKPLPTLPARIGVVTSSTGAALRDILSVLKRRFPLIPVRIYPSQVQGVDAPIQIVKAITQAVNDQACDVLILARGGGSIEDLWAFNDEQVARAIFACPIPTVSGVGHEIDFTIADFVADVRAPTPSVAAEMVSPKQEDWLEHLERNQAMLTQILQRMLLQMSNRLEQLHKRLRHPQERLQTLQQKLDLLEQRLKHAIYKMLQQFNLRLARYVMMMESIRPDILITAEQNKIAAYLQRLNFSIQQQLQQYQHHLSLKAQALNTLSPLATLDRGYSLTTTEQGEVIKTSSQVKNGEIIKTRLTDGEVLSQVIK